MKKRLLLVGVAAVVAAMYVAGASGSRQTRFAPESQVESTTQLPFGLVSPQEPAWIVVDPVGQHVFVSAGDGFSSVVVLDFNGTIVKTIGGIGGAPNVPGGASGMALDAATHTLYVGSAGITNDTMTEIDTTTLTMKGSFSTAPFYDINDLVIAGGKLWFVGRAAPGYSDGIGSVNLDGSSVTAQNLGEAYDLASGGISGNLLGLAEQGTDYRPGIAVYDVSSGSPTLVSSLADVGPEGSAIPALAFDPSGDHLLVPDLGTNAVDSLLTSTLAPSFQYPTDAAAVAAATTSDGAYVAVGGETGSQNVLVFKAGDANLWHRWSLGTVSDHALAFSPDSSRLFAVTADQRAGYLDFNVLTDPTHFQAATTTALTASAAAVTYGQQASLTAQTTGTTTGTVDLSATANGTTTVVASQSIDSSGAASFSVTPSQNTTYSATLEAGSDNLSSTSSNVTVGVKPGLTIADQVQRTNILQLLTRGEKVDIAAQISPQIQSPLQFKVQWKVHHRWHTVASVEAILSGGLAGVQFKIKIPGRYRAIAVFAHNTDYLGASSKWVRFKAPTHLG